MLRLTWPSLSMKMPLWNDQSSFFRFASITLIEKHLLKSPVHVDIMVRNYSSAEKILVQQKQNKVFDDSLDYRDDEQHVQLMRVDTNVSLLVVELWMSCFVLVEWSVEVYVLPSNAQGFDSKPNIKNNHNQHFSHLMMSNHIVKDLTWFLSSNRIDMTLFKKWLEISTSINTFQLV